MRRYDTEEEVMIMKIIGLVSLLIAVAAFTIFRVSTARDAAPLPLTAMYRGINVEIEHESRLTQLMKQYVNIGVERFMNQIITDRMINDAGKFGLRICLNLNDGDVMPISGYQSEVNVRKIYILDNEQKWAIAFLDDTAIALALTEEEMVEIYNCINTGR